MHSLLSTILFLFMFGLGSVAQAQTNDVKLAFGPDSKMWITGTSTVHDWKCDVNKTEGSVTASVADNLSGISAGTFTALVENIDCDSRIMNKKVNQALNDKDTPAISFEIESAHVGDEIHVTGFLTLAGVTKKISFPVTGSVTGDTMTFTGEVPVLMTDYNVDPPTAMLGTLKTGDEVKVHFEIVSTIPNTKR